MELDWLCTGVLKVRDPCLMKAVMNYSACWRSKKALVSTSDVTPLIPRQIGLQIVCSVITKIFNLCKCWGHISTFFNWHLWLFMLGNNCPSPVIVIQLLFVHSCFIVHPVYSASDSGIYSRYFNLVKHQPSPSKSINIRLHCLCLSIGPSGLLLA